MSLYNKIIDLQKLQSAWRDVLKNKPKEGVDCITYEMFEENKKEYLKELWEELVNHTYECLPVQLVPLYKGEKVRYISLYCMRDKVVQNSISRELSLLYEAEFSDSVYAYRRGKSALQAAQVIEKNIVKTGKGYALRTDIHAFFDCILHDVLIEKLREKIREEDVMNLILKIIQTSSLEKNGELAEKKIGIYQGATIAPILSNIYMMDIDRKVERDVGFYIRYSDDILLLFPGYEAAISYKKQLSLYLEGVGLSLNEQKTEILSFEEGFEFLGYRFDGSGISVPQKAEQQLEQRLEDVWMNPDFHSLNERLEKGLEIVNGWEQYFTSEREIHSIMEYAVWVYQMERKRNLNLEEMRRRRISVENSFKDIALYLAGIWRKNQMPLWVLYEYEEYYGLSEMNKEMVLEENDPFVEELLDLYSRYVVQEADELRVELIQIYSDMKMYQKATVLTERAKENIKSNRMIRIAKQEPCVEKVIHLSSDEISRYLELFAGREDVYAIDTISERGKRKCEEVLQPLLPEVVKRHLQGDETISTFVQRSNGTAKFLVIDVDISKGVLLQNIREEISQEYMNQCLHAALEIMQVLSHLGLKGYLEWSGYRGYHVWVFLSEWIPVRYINFLEDIISQKTKKLWESNEIQMEYFPNKTRVRNGKKGQSIKMPWGIHPKTGKRSYFIDSDGQQYLPQKHMMKDVAQFSGNTVRRIVSANRIEENEQEKIQTEVDYDLGEFGELTEAVCTVLNSCNLLRYLCQKARKTHYLNHFERLTILYVFGHVGEEGKEFIHKVMSFTLNYSYQTTQKFINRCPEKPISCLKLREQYKQITAEISCSCNFKRTKNCYPSPVLHALKDADENCQVTIPLSKTISADKQKILKNEINTISKAQEIAEKMMELRKQKRNLEKSIKKCEQELGTIFDDKNTDSMEVKMGLLTRRKNNGEVEWVIEL